MEPEIKGVIFDLDNTLLRYGERRFQLYAVAAATAAVNLGLPKTYSEALVIARESRAACDDDLAVFVADFGMEEHALMDEFNAVAVKMLPPLAATPGYIATIEGLSDKFNRLSPDRPLAVLTHATRSWTEPMLEHIGLHFKPDLVFPQDHPLIAYRKKNELRAVFEVVVRAMNLPAENIAVVEDTEENLVIPAALGMYTVLVTGGKNPGPLPHVREYVDSVTDFLRPALFPELGFS